MSDKATKYSGDHLDKVYNSKNPLVKQLFNKRLDIVRDFLPNQKIKILDAGCGEGHLLQKLGSIYTKYGIDNNEAAIIQAKKRCPEAKLKIGDITKRNYEENFFDAVICMDVLEHIEEYEQTIEELKRITKPNGCLIFSFPNLTNQAIARAVLLRFPIFLPEHINNLSPKKITGITKLPIDKIEYLPIGIGFNWCVICLMKMTKKA